MKKRCRNCKKNPVDERIGDGSIWCRECNAAWLKEAKAEMGMTEVFLTEDDYAS